MSERLLKKIKDEAVEFVDLRFTDTPGKEQHITLPAHVVEASFFENGKMFDGSSIKNWRSIHESDMILKPDTTALSCIDPFVEAKTLILRCDVLDPKTGKGYERDPRSVAKRAEAYLQQSGIADAYWVGPEPEFFIFDNVQYEVSINNTNYKIDSEEAEWNSSKHIDGGNLGHRPGLKGGYFPVAPVDAGIEMRNIMCQTLEEMGIPVEAHHHEVATAGQNEIATKCNTLTHKADESQYFKYVVKQVARFHGKTATFMPKPLVGDNGSGMHCHQSLSLKGKNLFAGEGYAHLSELALYFIGGIIHHAKALNAFTNSTTNSYKRLVPGFEAPVLLAYSSCNRSASIRVPYAPSDKGRRIEVRFPDACSNPYLAFSALLMAGLDGISKKIHPGDPMDHDLYELPLAEQKRIPHVAGSLEEALRALEEDSTFLTQGNVFSKDMLAAYIDLKQQEVIELNRATHPLEFKLYYSL